MSVSRKEKNPTRRGFVAAMLPGPGTMKRRHNAAAFFLAPCVHIGYLAESIDGICSRHGAYMIIRWFFFDRSIRIATLRMTIWLPILTRGATGSLCPQRQAPLTITTVNRTHGQRPDGPTVDRFPIDTLILRCRLSLSLVLLNT
jgi:hypothetical protein